MSYLQTLTLSKWLSDTSVRVGVRGQALVTLDRAIADYCAFRSVPSHCLTVTDQLKKAFEAWVLRKMHQAGQGLWHPGQFQDPAKNRVWQKHRRNHKGAFTMLYEELYTDAELTARVAAKRAEIKQCEQEAIAYMQECTEKLAAKLFYGKTCELRLKAEKAAVVITVDPSASASSSLMDDASAFYRAHGESLSNRASLIGGVVGGVQAVAQGSADAVLLAHSGGRSGELAGWLRKLLTKIATDKRVAQPSALVDAFISLNRPLLSKVYKTMTPLAGTLTSIGTGVYEVGTAALQAYAAQSIAERPFIKGLTAKAAVEAVTRLMKEEAKRQAKHGAHKALVGAARLVTEVVPGLQGVSVGVGIYDALAELMWVFLSYLDNCKTRDAMNALLSALPDPEIDGGSQINMATGIALFSEFPLLGAYWVMIAETSSVIGICADDLASGTFMQQVEEICRTHLASLRTAAADLIAASPLVIPELSAHRLIVGADGATPHSTRFRRVVDTIKDTYHGWTIYRRAARIFPPPAWKDRVVGLSSEEFFAQQDAIENEAPAENVSSNGYIRLL